MTANDRQIIETTLLRGQLKLLQPKNGFHASTDTVLLAAATRIRDRQRLLDVGCGVGSAGLCVALKNKSIQLTGIDIQPELTDIALQNAALNDLSVQCRFFHGAIDQEKNIENNYFDAVLTNPPYVAGAISPSPLRNKTLSHDEGSSGITLKKWCKYIHSKLKNGGYMTMIHRADRLDEIVTVLTERRWFGSLVIRPIHSRKGEPAKRIIVQARKERYSPLKLLDGLVMHEKDGGYTKTAVAILDGKQAIEMS